MDTILPIQGIEAYMDLKQSAKIQVTKHTLWDWIANSLNKPRILTENLPIGDLCINIQMAGIFWRMDASGNYISDGDAGGLDSDYATLSESALCVVDQCRVILNDSVLVNDSELQQFFKYKTQLYDKAGDDESESLSYFVNESGINANGSIDTGLVLPTKTTMATSD